MFERFTERARRALFFARYESKQFGSPTIESEHLLLGLVRDGSGLTQQLLARSRISLDSLRQDIERRIVAREKVETMAEIPFSEEAKRILMHSVDEADGLGDRHIGTEHILLGLLREERSVAAMVLLERALNLEVAREWFVKSRGDRSAGESGTEGSLRQLMQENASLREIIRRLEHKPQTPLQFRDNAYWLEHQDGTAEGPYCGTCWDIDRRLIRKLIDAGGTVYCDYCANHRL